MIADLFKYWLYRLFAPGALLRQRYEAFRKLLEHDKKSHELIAALQELSGDRIRIDFTAVKAKCAELSFHVSKVTECLAKLHPSHHAGLSKAFEKIDASVKGALISPEHSASPPFILHFDAITPDSRLLVGNKGLKLAIARNVERLPVPEGFAVTTNAFRYFIRENRLQREIDKRLSMVDLGSATSLESLSRELREMIQKAEAPEPLIAAISKAVHTLRERNPDMDRFSVRSSAVGEDGQCSYAGQYATVLNVPGDDIVEACKQVIASKYSARALSYRITHGDIDEETSPAVLVMPMIDAKVSGVIYTQDPTDADPETLLIYCLWGLGELLVGGAAIPAIIKVSKHPPHRVKRQQETVQESKMVPAPQGGAQMLPCDDLPAASSALTDDQVKTLLRWALRLEESDGLPQDIEWCADHRDRLFILQSRPLMIEDSAGETRPPDAPRLDNPVLLEGGIRASGGIAAGAVCNMEQEAGLDAVSAGSILVAKHALPDYAAVMDRIAALVTDRGSTAGHLATVARELGIPALVATESATNILTSGRLVTVDADRQTIYEGKPRASELLVKPAGRAARSSENPFAQKLGKALQSIAPLHLTDPQADSFIPQECRTFHDILRFSHEKSVMEMFSLGKEGSRRARGIKKLRCDIPIVVYLLDLGGGISEAAADKKEIQADAIRCVPFKSLWKGLGHPEIYWDPNVLHFDWNEFDRFSHGIVKTDSVQFGSYALISADYLNFHICFGYHFVVVDTLCTDASENNHLTIRFAGGGAQAWSRQMRVRFLGEVLTRLGFHAEQKGDLIDARLGRIEPEEMKKALEEVGILLGCTRLLDMALTDESQVHTLVERFLAGDYALSPLNKK